MNQDEIESYISKQVRIILNEQYCNDDATISQNLGLIILQTMELVEDYNMSRQNLTGKIKENIVWSVVKTIIGTEMGIFPITILETVVIGIISACIVVSKKMAVIQDNIVQTCNLCCKPCKKKKKSNRRLLKTSYNTKYISETIKRKPKDIMDFDEL